MSRLFPAWYFATRPHTNVIAASHTAELAETNSAYVQRFIRDNADVLDCGLRNDRKGNWETTHDCRCRAVGCGAAITGFRADVAILADPIKSRAEAESLLSRTHLGGDWHSLYQCQPRPLEGGMFKPGEMRMLDVRQYDNQGIR